MFCCWASIANHSYFTAAAKRVGELISLDPNDKEITRLKESIDKAAKAYFEPAIEWITKNMRFARRKIDEIEPGLYYPKLYYLVENLSFDSLQKIDENTLTILSYLFNEVTIDTEYKSEDDPTLKMFQVKLRSILHFR